MAAAVCALSATGLAAAYRTRELSAVEVVQAHLDRIEELDARLGSYISVDRRAAILAAELADLRFRLDEPASLLDGVPLGVKDNIDVEGFITTGASSTLGRAPAAHDAGVISRVRAAGAVILGKQSLFEIAAGGGPRVEPGFPAARNPWDLAYVPGGSSSGSAAAVAAGLATVSVGSDTGGSVRLPAALCGIVGFKPSAGTLSTQGILPLSWSLDQVGPLTRTVADARLLFHVMAGRAPRGDDRATGSALRGSRVGVPEVLLAAISEMSPEVSTSFRTALRVLSDAGAHVIPLDVPGARSAGAIGTVILRAEAFAAYGPTLRESPNAFGQRVRALLLEGALISSEDYVRAKRARAQLTQALAGAMGSLDLIAMPTSPLPAWLMADDVRTTTVRWSPTRNLPTFLFSVTGQPAVSVPCGSTSTGMPIGLQLAARHGEDAFLLRAAQDFEDIRPWPRPPIAMQA